MPARRWLRTTLCMLLAVSLIARITEGRRHRRNDISSTNEVCYKDGEGQKCLPEFKDLARNMPLQATSTCGNPPGRVCRVVEDNLGRARSECSLCDASRPEKWHPAAFLTDRHNINNETCWISGPLDPAGENTVNLTLSFNKRFEILYIYLRPCGHLPDSLVYYKSVDFGKTWRPWRYFSKDCFRAFGLPTMDSNRFAYTDSTMHDAFCEQLKPLSAYKSVDGARILFSSSTPQASHDNPAIIDWRTATDLRVSMSRFPASGQARPRPVRQPTYLFSRFAGNAEPQRLYYSFSQLSVGGRCKCNGHGNDCLWKNGKMRCVCHHNTQGDDCEQCKPFYYNKPWSRATDADAHVCEACTCNNHTTKCRFSSNAYHLSKQSSGGICIDCQHNTMGPNCEQCANGYYRDPNLSITDEHACAVCNCHPLGSMDVDNCDPLSGQCKCKSGVVGQTCNRCQKGYRQTGDLQRPCQPVLGGASTTCNQCRPQRRNSRIRFKKFCRRDFAVHIVVRSRQNTDSHVRFQFDVNAVFRRHGQAQQFIPLRRSRTPLVFWVSKENLNCKCPDVKIGRSYLLLSDAIVFQYRSQRNLLLNHKSTLLEWKPAMRRRMIKFKRREKRRGCSVGRRVHRKRNIRNRRGRQRKKSSSRNRHQRRRGYRYNNRLRTNQQSTYVDYYRSAYQGDHPSSSSGSSNYASDRYRVTENRENNYGYYGTK